MNDTKQDFQYAGERFADIQMLRYRLKGFEALSLKEKKLVYYLSEAVLSGRDITFDQFGAYNLKIRRVLEAVYLHYKGDRTAEDYRSLETYLKRVWFSSGIHHHYNQCKFAPDFPEEFFRSAVLSLPEGCLPLSEGQSAEDLCDELAPVIFDSEVMKKRVCIDEGADLVLSSACNYYKGVTQEEAENYYKALRESCGNSGEMPSFGLNSALVKDADGTIREQVWRIGGTYSKQIERIVYWLDKACAVCESEEQRNVIRLLTEYYATGDLSVFDKYSVAWTALKDCRVDFINGFIEVYGDPLGIKGSWEGIVHYQDLDATLRTRKICDNAQWFEDNSPVDPRFKKKEVRGVTANVVCAAMLGGDEYPASAIGINLPNADWIRAKHGSKSITIGNLTEAYANAARGSGFRREFVIDNETVEMMDQYGDICDDLHTDLHECLGHGSGQLLPGVSSNALKSYGSALEEARADLFGLYYIADKKLVELGLLPCEEAYKAQYYAYLLNGLLTQTVRIPLGGQIEEAHMRNRALISRWVMERSGGAIELVKRNNKTYLRINDYAKTRLLFARLLAEVQRIKSEGDYNAAKALIETYGVKLDKELHSEMLRRYETLDIAPYKGFINPVLRPETDSCGNITDIIPDYSETYAAQMLRYSRAY